MMITEYMWQSLNGILSFYSHPGITFTQPISYGIRHRPCPLHPLASRGHLGDLGRP